MSTKRIRKQDIADRFVLFLNVVVLVALGLSYLAGVISPEKFWVLAFFGFGYPIILITITIFIIYWLFRRKWFLFLNIALLVAKWDYVSATIKFNSNKNSDSEGIKIMTYNVRLFDRYNWSNNKNTRFKAQEFIFNQQPDILCIQEFYNRKGDKFRAIDTLLNSNSIKHIHTENYAATQKSKHTWGIATLTSYPILDKGKITFPDSRSALVIFTDVLINDDTVRVYNLHLQSIHLGNADYAVLDDLMEAQELENVSGGRIVLSRMKSGFLKRAHQADIVAAHIKECSYPTIVCGDFNDVPTSYTYQTISKGLRDSFSKSGSRLGNTYVRVPFFRIDNILYSPKFKTKNHTVHPYELSDHLAVTAVLEKTE